MAIALALGSGLGLVAWAGSLTTARRELALRYYDQAVIQRLDIEALPEDQRTSVVYEKAAGAFHRVYLTSPQSSKADDSLLAVGEIYTAMEQRFGPGPYRSKAIQAYEFLIREYPLSPLLEQARQKLEALKALPAPPAKEDKPSAPIASNAAPSSFKGLPHVTEVRHWSLPGLTRVVISLEAEAKVKGDRLTNPDRVYLDLRGIRLAPELKATVPVNDELVKQIRLAHTQVGVTRVVVDLKVDAVHTLSMLTNPPRVVVELRERGAAAATAPTATATPATVTATKAPEPAASPASPSPRVVPPNAAQAGMVAATRQPEPAAPSPGSPKVARPKAGQADLGATRSPETSAPSSSAPSKVAPSKDVQTAVAAAKPADPAATSLAPSASPKMAPPKAAQPTSRGERNLVRALGLKIGRVVIDAGHGGHDTGTIGPTGFMEKDLTLDIAKRLGDLIAERTGSEVVFTRSEDSFVALEERTTLANEKQADLFISIHANSSRLPGVRGIETYYLNLTADREAMEVAARENAASQKSIHELQDLVAKITLTEKISESREFASQVQRALYTTVARDNATLRNRGVRKAPFVVLIGARMPSVLAEISFLSNPRDEKLLKTPAYRQKIAEALYKGVAGYSNTLSRVEVAVKQQ
ncbi:MAG: N-acetylmuramoyl-L-alanine amidase [Acidobacteria bacterium]|nr:N-acetylmuramoyl-L-alanine amidase [Acidobacteriota bacterium]